MKFKKTDNGFLVRCDIGEEVVSTLADFATEQGIASGSVTGIGALKHVVLGYYNVEGKEYLKKEFSGNFELLNLTGNFAKLGSDYILHCHATISDVHCEVFGGHLFKGTIAITGEFYITPGGIEVNRGPDDTSGLNLVKL